MIKTLRRRFIVIAVASVAIVLFIIIGAANILNYLNIVRSIDTRMQILADNIGAFSEELGRGPHDKLRDDMIPFGRGERKDFFMDGITEEFPYEARFFTVTIKGSGEVQSIDTDRIAAVKTEDAEKYALLAQERRQEKGFINDYRYEVVDSDDGSRMYIFLDCVKEMSSFRNFLFVSVLISLLGLVLVFIMVLLLSKIVMKPVAESYKKQKQFITDASHELKTPVAIIDANTEVIESESGESEWTKSIRKQTTRMTSLIEKMVFLSRMDEGVSTYEMENINVSSVFQEVAESFEVVAIKKNVKYDINIDEDAMLKGDSKTLAQMLSLLLDNAFKYTQEEGNVSIHFTSNGKGGVLTVRNSVEEIEIGKHNELFERFYRRDKSRNSKTGGFGIGLSVVRAIVENHKGKITAKSTDGKSIEFKVTL